MLPTCSQYILRLFAVMLRTPPFATNMLRMQQTCYYMLPMCCQCNDILCPRALLPIRGTTPPSHAMNGPRTPRHALSMYWPCCRAMNTTCNQCVIPAACYQYSTTLRRMLSICDQKTTNRLSFTNLLLTCCETRHLLSVCCNILPYYAINVLPIRYQ